MTTRTVRPIVRLSASGNPVTRPADAPDAVSPTNDKQGCADLLFDALRDIELGNNELTVVERILGEAGGGEVILRLASVIERCRRAERRRLVRELAPDAAIAEKLAGARADERALVEAEARADWAVAQGEIEAAHRAELAKLRAAWSTVSTALAG
jgi:hypothetical protein